MSWHQLAVRSLRPLVRANSQNALGFACGHRTGARLGIARLNSPSSPGGREKRLFLLQRTSHTGRGCACRGHDFLEANHRA
jgi:hypothetical protein